MRKFPEAVDTRPIRKIANRARLLSDMANQSAGVVFTDAKMPDIFIYQQMQLLKEAMDAWLREKGQDQHLLREWKD